MATHSNVTTPGGFFVGIGGIVVFCVVSAVVFFWVKRPAVSDEFHKQQVALGLRPAPDASFADAKKKEGEVGELLAAAAQRYNAGEKPDIDRINDLCGVVRYRESEKSKVEAGKVLTAPIAWKDKAKGEVTVPIDVSMKLVASGLKDRKPKPSAVKVDVMPTLDPNAPPILPNAMGGGVKTVIFADPNAQPAPAAPTATPPAPAPVPTPAKPADPAKPATAPAPGTPAPSTTPPAPVPPAPAPTPEKPADPAKPAAPPPAPAKPPGATTALNAAVSPRPPLLNWLESKK